MIISDVGYEKALDELVSFLSNIGLDVVKTADAVQVFRNWRKAAVDLQNEWETFVAAKWEEWMERKLYENADFGNAVFDGEGKVDGEGLDDFYKIVKEEFLSIPEIAEFYSIYSVRCKEAYRKVFLSPLADRRLLGVYMRYLTVSDNALVLTFGIDKNDLPFLPGPSDYVDFVDHADNIAKLSLRRRIKERKKRKR